MELSEEQRQSLSLFREVTAEARDEASSIEVLKSCNWNAPGKGGRAFEGP